MSEPITGVLKFAFGLISNKLRSYGAKKLQDGGLVDQTFRGVIVREMDDIKYKLDANARKDLSTSISCLQLGVERLIMCFGESFESGNPSSSETDGKQSPDTTNTGATSNETKPVVQKSATVEDAVALANAIRKLKVVSNERFASAKESFKESGKQASQAFHNASLSTTERVLASKVRIASGILEHLDDPEFAANDCLRYVRELNAMPAIQQMISVRLEGGIKALLKTDSRYKMEETIVVVNLILADFISKYAKQRMAVLDWPMVEFGKACFSPNDTRLLQEEITLPWDIVELEDGITRDLKPDMCTFNNRRDLICFFEDGHCPQKLDTATGKLQPCCLSPLEDKLEHPEPNSIVLGVAVDEDDTVYVLSGYKNVSYTLSVYSADGRNTHHYPLKFAKWLYFYAINVTKDKNIVICHEPESKGDDITVYLCNSKGELIYIFKTGLDSHSMESVSVTCNNEIILVVYKQKRGFLKDSYALYIYTQLGKLRRTVKFNRSKYCNLPYRNIFYNQVTKTITAGCIDNEGDIVVEYFSGQTGEHQCSYLLYSTTLPENLGDVYFVCHENGAVVLVGPKHVVFLQRPSM